ncbi:sugar-phosphatase [Saccharothrix ecbatanensis]|uniref:Sugar-phosphatase n=1 Tax=Saccharothrix ecbatanensis TaxID=1105145 RepID=A0A7W9HJL2_9PSEU|nr:HAD-IA family hydrolase [Saccharothrix ecbatanensis]MBB5803138.1 sugar-phosphatase [Saccharothrix ecbatanensis]
MRIECDAVLFDVDGVLVGSMELIESVLREWAADAGLEPDSVVALSHGRRDVDLIRLVAPVLDAEAEAQRIADREEHLLAGLREVPGAGALVAALPAGSWSAVTSGTRRVAAGRLAAAGLPVPVHLVGAEDVVRGKPDPEGYLKAARLLGIAPQRCLVFEDAVAGVRAADAAGMRCVGVSAATRALGDELAGWVEDLRTVCVHGTTRGLFLEVEEVR